jgi:hypothetical protein
LIDNFPGHDSFDPSLPIGVLTITDEVLATRVMGPDSDRPGFGLALATSGLSQTGSDCGQVSSNSDDSNTNAAAFYGACFRYYQPSQNDSSPNWKWRQLFSTGSAHGGNFSHDLEATHNRTQVTGPNQDLDHWKPSGSLPYSSCTTRTDTLAVEVPGVSASASDSYDICPDRYGMTFLDLVPDKYWYGWNGGLNCGPAPCTYIGNAGGYSAKIPQNGTWQHTQVIGISWGL